MKQRIFFYSKCPFLPACLIRIQPWGVEISILRSLALPHMRASSGVAHEKQWNEVSDISEGGGFWTFRLLRGFGAAK